MKTTYSERIPQRKEDYRLIQEYTNQLEEILGSSSDNVHVQWDNQQDEMNQPVYLLSLQFGEWEVSGRFTPDELRSHHHVMFRLYRLWGDLLHKENQTRIEKLISQGD